jgi:hypothetical protein
VTLLLMPWFAELRGDGQRHHTVITAIVLAAFVAVVLGGYLGGWSWTEFTGNTLWDWLHLLLLPTVIVPALSPIAMGHVTVVAEQEGATASTAVEVAPPLA